MSEQAHSSPREPAVHELAAQVLVQMGGLAGQEIALAKAELHARARNLGMGSVMLTAGGFVGITAWLVLLAAAIAGIAVALPAWAAILIVGGFLAVTAAGITALGGRRVARATPLLPMTIESIRRDVQEIREIREKAWR